jgi:hypothetical protein
MDRKRSVELMSNVPPSIPPLRSNPPLRTTDLPSSTKPAAGNLAPAKQPVIAKPPSAAPPRATKFNDSGDAKFRRSVYAILIALSVGTMAGRVLAVNSVDVIRSEAPLKSAAIEQEKQKLQAAGQLAGKTDQDLEQLTRAEWQKQRPFLSANDRSRWLTVRALVEHGTYAIEPYLTDPKTYPNWDCIDVVMHTDAAGAPHLYSSKPPLLATLYAAPYWVIYKITAAIHGTPATLSTNPYEIDRAMLMLVNVLPLVIYFWVLAKILELYGRTDWGRIFVMAAATFATFLTTFAVVLNNHLLAAVCAVITLYAALLIWYEEERRLRYFLLAGFFAAFTAACELPALSFFALISVAVLWKAPRQTLLGFLPAAAIVLAAFFATNWFAHHSLIPPYAHRVENQPPAVATTEAPAGANAALQSTPADASGTAASQSTPANSSDQFQGTLTLDPTQTVTLRGNSSNWYDYEYTRTDGKLVESYWRRPQGIDEGEASIGKYALNVLVGHHGIFSLTPIWLLAIPGMLILIFNKDYRLPGLAAAVALISMVCILFYIFRPVAERNYGGATSGFRWVFWFAPLWLLAVLPTADKLSAWRVGRGLGYLLLAFSVLSAAYPVWNPWTHPWLMNFWTYLGW